MKRNKHIYTFLVVILGILFSQGTSFRDDIEFVEYTISDSAFGAKSVYLADVDGDGNMDVLSASGTSIGTIDKIAWYENDGNENFTEYTISDSASDTRSVHAVDVDGDGYMDVLSASFGDDKIAWYKNDGNENFTEYSISTSANGAHFVYAADVDGDGYMDVLSASFVDNKIAWYKNDGNENFTEYSISTSANGARSAYAADVDGDGYMDVLSASFGDDKIAWYKNDGNENFTEYIISTNIPKPVSIFAEDLDGDGDIDVLSAFLENNKIVWYENDGNENFTEYIISEDALQARYVYAADVDGDGDMDVLSASDEDNKISWYRNMLICDAVDCCDAGYTYFAELPDNVTIIPYYEGSDSCLSDLDLSVLDSTIIINELDYAGPINVGNQTWNNGRLTQLVATYNPNGNNGVNKQLERLPDNIDNWEELSSIYLEWNRLEEMPASFWELTNVHSIALGNNLLSVLPPTFGNFGEQLFYLDLGYNQLTSLPEGICYLENLSYLYLFYNNLTELPECMCAAEALPALDFNDTDGGGYPYFGTGGNELCGDVPDCIENSQFFESALDQFYYLAIIEALQDCCGNGVYDWNENYENCPEEVPGCNLPENSIDLLTEALDPTILNGTEVPAGTILYNSSDEIKGFQFYFDGATPLSVYGGEAENNSFWINTNESTHIVLGFGEFYGQAVEGCGILTIVEFEGTPTGLSGLVFNDDTATEIDFSYFGSAAPEDWVEGCTDPEACNYNMEEGQQAIDYFGCTYYDDISDVCCELNDQDCFGVCFGDAVEDNCGTCDFDSSNDCMPDCSTIEEQCTTGYWDGEFCWGGSAVADCAGICSGSAVNCPDWEDDPSAYEFTATMTAVVLDSVTQISGEGDILAAFDEEGNIRGLAIQVEIPADMTECEYAGSTAYEMQIRSNIPGVPSGEMIGFQYFDASEDIVLEIFEFYEFSQNEIIGTLCSPHILPICRPDGCGVCNGFGPIYGNDGGCCEQENDYGYPVVDEYGDCCQPSENGVWDEGEEFVDENGNSIWDEGEDFVDVGMDACGECGGDGSSCATDVTISFGNIDGNAGTVEIYMQNYVPVAGVQLEIHDYPDYLDLIDINGGSSEEYYSTISWNNIDGWEIILAYDLSGNTIPEGEDLLYVLTFENNNEENIAIDLCFDGVLTATPEGGSLSVTVGDCGIMAPYDLLLGDINGDGTLDVLDIVLMVNLILSDSYVEEGDLNFDGYLDILDAVSLINLILDG